MVYIETYIRRWIGVPSPLAKGFSVDSCLMKKSLPSFWPIYKTRGLFTQWIWRPKSLYSCRAYVLDKEWGQGMYDIQFYEVMTGWTHPCCERQGHCTKDRDRTTSVRARKCDTSTSSHGQQRFHAVAAASRADTSNCKCNPDANADQCVSLHYVSQ